MKKYANLVVIAAVVCGSILVTERSWSQVGPGFTPSYPRSRTAYPMFPEARGNNELAKLVHQLRDAEDGTKKAELAKQLEAAVGKTFDQDLDVREKELFSWKPG